MLDRLLRLKDRIFIEVRDIALRFLYPRRIHLDWDQSSNLGDKINPFVFSIAANRRVVASKSNLFQKYTAIGSILDRSLSPQTCVWGTGFISAASKPKSKPKDILAVRGPLTRQIFIDHGIDCPSIYGDPFLLLHEFYPPKKTKSDYPFGIIAHYSDFDSLNLED